MSRLVRDADGKFASRHDNAHIPSGDQPFPGQCRGDRAAARTAGKREIFDTALKGYGFQPILPDKPDKADVGAFGKGWCKTQVAPKPAQPFGIAAVPVLQQDDGMRQTRAAEFNIAAVVFCISHTYTAPVQHRRIVEPDAVVYFV